VERKDFIRSLGLAGFGLYSGLTGQAGTQIKREESYLSPLLIDKNGKVITTLKGWEDQRKVIESRWLGYLGYLKPNPNPPILRVIKEDNSEGLVRQLVEYEGEPGIIVQGYLIKPQNISKPLPGVVAMHSTSYRLSYIAGFEEGKPHAYGYNLARLGFVVFCPLCFLWWNNEDDHLFELQVKRFRERHPDSKGMARMLFDAMRAVDVLVSLKEVDKGRIGAMGHSLGAKEVLYLAAFDERVKAVVSNEGGIGIDFSNWDAPWYLDKDIHNFGHQHHEVLALVAPRPFLLIGGDYADGEKSRPYIEAVMPVYDLYGKKECLQLYNHGTGHDVTPEAEKRTYQWLKDHLV